MTPRNPRKKKASDAPSAAVNAPASTSGRQQTAMTVRTEGQRLLIAAPGSLSEVARMVGSSKATVGDWRTGNKLPGPAYREGLREKYGIPVEAWRLAPGGTPLPAATPVEPIVASGHPSTLQDVTNILASIRTDLVNPNLLSSERVKLTDSFTRTLKLKHQIEKDQESQESDLVKKHPIWLKIKAAIVEVLVQFPDAARAVADKLEALEGEP